MTDIFKKFEANFAIGLDNGTWHRQTMTGEVWVGDEDGEQPTHLIHWDMEGQMYTRLRSEGQEFSFIHLLSYKLAEKEG